MNDLNFYSYKKQYHRFVTKDFALIQIGIASYTTSSLSRFFGLNEEGNRLIPINPDVNEFFTNQIPLARNKLIGVEQQADMSIFEFDIQEKIYKETIGLNQIVFLNPQKYPRDKFTPPSSNLTIFLKEWDEIQNGLITDQKKINGYKAVVYKIQNSKFGCIKFKTDITILTRPRTIDIKLHFSAFTKERQDKSISIAGSPVITRFPSTSYDAGWSAKSREFPVGAYIGGDTNNPNNPEDSVSAEIGLAFDPSTNEFQSGTRQIFAVLLEDIDPADNAPISAEQIAIISRAEVYDTPASESILGNFTTGKAIPLSTENGNPYMFGPDFKGGCEGDIATRITVRNRRNQRYKAGSTVIVSRMLGENGDWIIVSEGDPEDPKPKFGMSNYEFQQFIIPLDSYFTNTLNRSQDLSPSVIESKIRDWWYVNLTGLGAGGELTNFLKPNIVDPNVSVDINSIKKLNHIAHYMPQDTEDPISYLIDRFNSIEGAIDMTVAVVNSLDMESIYIDNLFNIYDLNYAYYLRDNAISDIFDPKYQLPKNATQFTGRSFGPLSLNETGAGQGDPLYGLEVPMFWGALFPDGHTAQSSTRLLNNIKNKFGYSFNTIPTYYNDGNLKEMDVRFTAGFPNVGDLSKNLEIYQDSYQFSNSVSVFPMLPRYLSHFNLMGNLINAVTDYRNRYGTLSQTLNEVAVLPALEPLNPRKIQFSPLSLEGMYVPSIIQVPENLIDSNLSQYDPVFWASYSWDFIQIPLPVFQSANLVDYGLHLLGNFVRSTPYTSPAVGGGIANNPLYVAWGDAGTQYRSEVFSYMKAFDNGPKGNSVLFTRFQAPVGTLFGAVPRPFSGDEFSRRTPVIPVITSRCTITTNANALSFDVSQSVGLNPEISLSKPRTPRLIALPLSAGVAWVDDPGSPAKEGQTPAWGSVDDTYDSLGTTGLHVRVFESRPMDQCIYLGNWFTPLYFNPSGPVDSFNKIIKYNDDGSAYLEVETDNDGKPVKKILDVDFRVPGNKSGSPLIAGTKIPVPPPGQTSTILANFGDWPWNTIRRSQLLSAGGFAYLKPILAIHAVSSVPEFGGENYRAGDTFTYPDGSLLVVNGVASQDGKQGVITSVRFVPSWQGNMIKAAAIPYESITSISSNISLRSDSENGKFAKFKVLSLIVINTVGYDPPPKEVVGISRISEKIDPYRMANRGQTSVFSLPESESRSTNKFDVYYFFHNDPTHYSIDKTRAFSGGFAQYIISEMNPS